MPASILRHAALEYPCEAERPRLILLDPLLPVLDGWQFQAKRLKEVSLAAVPVILLAAGATTLVEDGQEQAIPSLRGLEKSRDSVSRL